MSCGNTKQQLERAGINALDTCKAPYRINADSNGICNSFYSEHRDETAPLSKIYICILYINNIYKMYCKLQLSLVLSY